MKWFKHMTNAMDDLFVKDIERRFGDSGYAFWFKTLELIGNHGEDGKLDISWSNYLEKLHKRRAHVELMLDFCSTSGKLAVTFKKENVVIVCKKFAEYSDNYTKYAKPLQSNFKDTSKQEEEVDTEEDKKKSTVYDFESLWVKYPKPLGKKQAIKHFLASVKTDEDWKNINTALNNYLKTENVVNGNIRFIKHGSTWFNNWQDYITVRGIQKNEPISGLSIQMR